MLVDRNQDIIHQKDEYGNTGFLYACNTNKIEIVKFLLDIYPRIIY